MKTRDFIYSNTKRLFLWKLNNGNRNRFRYRLGVPYPLGKEAHGNKPFQVSASNELFFTDNEPGFLHQPFAANGIFLLLYFKTQKASHRSSPHDYHPKTKKKNMALTIFMKTYY